MTVTAGTISFVFTLLVFSYLLGDNFLYRLAVSVFVGLAAAFTAIAVIESAILGLPELDLFFAGEVFNPGVIFFIYIPVILVALLLLKPISGLKSLTNLALAYLIAVGAAAALVGAITGTIIPLTQDTTTITALDTGNLNVETVLPFVNSVIVLLGVATSLLYFRYQVRQNPDGTLTRSGIVRVLAGIGQAFIVVTLGAIYASAILTSLTILSGQISVMLSNI